MAQVSPLRFDIEWLARSLTDFPESCQTASRKKFGCSEPGTSYLPRCQSGVLNSAFRPLPGNEHPGDFLAVFHAFPSRLCDWVLARENWSSDLCAKWGAYEIRRGSWSSRTDRVSMGRAVLVLGMHRPCKLIWRSRLVGLACHPFVLPMACIHHVRRNEERIGCTRRLWWR